MTAPTAEDAIAEALMARDAEDVDWIDRDSAERYAAAVVAAVRAMSVEQQAELIGGEIERQARLSSGKPIPLSTPLGLQTAERLGRPIESRVVGPWQVTP